MKMATPRAMQGPDIVQVTYGWHEGDFYRRTFDQADRSVRWYVADDASAARLAERGYNAAGEVYAPEVTAWKPCSEPRE